MLIILAFFIIDISADFEDFRDYKTPYKKWDLRHEICIHFKPVLKLLTSSISSNVNIARRHAVVIIQTHNIKLPFISYFLSF